MFPYTIAPFYQAHGVHTDYSDDIGKQFQIVVHRKRHYFREQEQEVCQYEDNRRSRWKQYFKWRKRLDRPNAGISEHQQQVRNVRL